MKGALSGKAEGNLAVCVFFPPVSPPRATKPRAAFSPPASQGDCATINHQDLNGERSAEEGLGAGLREL